MTESKEAIPEVSLAEMAAATFALQGQSAGECVHCGCRDLRWCGEAFPRCRNCGKPVFAFVAVPPKVKDQNETPADKAAG